MPMVSSAAFLGQKGLRRNDLQFKGVLVTDYKEIENLHSCHKVAATEEDAVLMAMEETTIDMSMVCC